MRALLLMHPTLTEKRAFVPSGPLYRFSVWYRSIGKTQAHLVSIGLTGTKSALPIGTKLPATFQLLARQLSTG